MSTVIVLESPIALPAVPCRFGVASFVRFGGVSVAIVVDGPVVSTAKFRIGEKPVLAPSDWLASTV